MILFVLLSQYFFDRSKTSRPVYIFLPNPGPKSSMTLCTMNLLHGESGYLKVIYFGVGYTDTLFRVAYIFSSNAGQTRSASIYIDDGGEVYERV